MANLAHKDDSNIEVILKRDGTARVIKAMRGIPNSVHVQAAGSWALATLARKNEDLREQACFFIIATKKGVEPDFFLAEN